MTEEVVNHWENVLQMSAEAVVSLRCNAGPTDSYELRDPYFILSMWINVQRSLAISRHMAWHKVGHGVISNLLLVLTTSHLFLIRRVPGRFRTSRGEIDLDQA